MLLVDQTTGLVRYLEIADDQSSNDGRMIMTRTKFDQRHPEFLCGDLS